MRKIKFINKIILITIIVVIACSCTQKIADKKDAGQIQTHVNKSGHDLVIKKYYRSSTKQFPIPNNDSLVVHTQSMLFDDPINQILTSDSVFVIYDDGKKVMFVAYDQSRVNILNAANYEQNHNLEKRILSYRYVFTSKDYEAAR